MTFDVGEHHEEFGLFNDVKPSATFACCGCDTIDLDEPVNLPDLRALMNSKLNASFLLKN